MPTIAMMFTPSELIIGLVIILIIAAAAWVGLRDGTE